MSLLCTCDRPERDSRKEAVSSYLGQTGGEQHTLEELAHPLEELVHMGALQYIHLDPRSTGDQGNKRLGSASDLHIGCP